MKKKINKRIEIPIRKTKMRYIIKRSDKKSHQVTKVIETEPLDTSCHGKIDEIKRGLYQKWCKPLLGRRRGYRYKSQSKGYVYLQHSSVFSLRSASFHFNSYLFKTKSNDPVLGPVLWSFRYCLGSGVRFSSSSSSVPVFALFISLPSFFI